jgi:hypothetical protein
MSRPFRELVKDYESEPDRWEIVATETKPSTNRRNRGGTRVQELLRHKETGEEMVRHRVLKPDGTPFAEPHVRPMWK